MSTLRGCANGTRFIRTSRPCVIHYSTASRPYFMTSPVASQEGNQSDNKLEKVMLLMKCICILDTYEPQSTGP